MFNSIHTILDAPEPILSTLRGLGETLTVYVAGTTWDKQFRLALVSGAIPVHKHYESTELYCHNNGQVRNMRQYKNHLSKEEIFLDVRRMEP